MKDVQKRQMKLLEIRMSNNYQKAENLAMKNIDIGNELIELNAKAQLYEPYFIRQIIKKYEID